jgi:HD-like signal output (HDOD) protein
MNFWETSASKVTSINQAISLIGTQELQNITLSTIVIEKTVQYYVVFHI